MGSQPHTTHMQHCHTQIPYLWAFHVLKTLTKRNIHLGAAIVGIYRQDIYEIPPDAIRELIINAAVHRSYLDHGNIQIAIYDDRLEITSPGKLPMGQTLERMKEGYSQILSK